MVCIRNESAVCCVKLIDERHIQPPMYMLDLEETLNIHAKANGVPWYGPLLRRGNNMLRIAFDFEVFGRKEPW